MNAAENRRPGRPRASAQPLGIQSVETAFDVLAQVAKAGGPLSLSELSARTGLAPSKLHRYLVSLLRTGALCQSQATGHYDLGAGARSLGAAALVRFDGFEAVSQAAAAVSAELKANAFIYIWADEGPVLVRTTTSIRTVFSLRLGSSIPLLTTACGPIFLAYLADHATAPVLARRRERAPAGRPDLPSILQTVRSERLHWAADSVLPGFLQCATPIFDADEDLLCVLGLAIPDDRRDETGAITARMKQLSLQLSAELGAKAGR